MRGTQRPQFGMSARDATPISAESATAARRRTTQASAAPNGGYLRYAQVRAKLQSVRSRRRRRAWCVDASMAYGVRRRLGYENPVLINCRDRQVRPLSQSDVGMATTAAWVVQSRERPSALAPV